MASVITVLLNVFYAEVITIAPACCRGLGVFVHSTQGVKAEGSHKTTAYDSAGRGLYGTAYFINSRYNDEELNCKVFKGDE
jgi:hypothetical protein